jgi:O-antigen ligase
MLVTSIWPYDFKRMLEFALLLVLFLLPSFSRSIREKFGALLGGVPRWVAFTLIGVFGWGVLSALVNGQSAMHLANSLSEVALLASLVLGVFVVGACRRVSGLAFDRMAVSLIAMTGLVVGTQELLGVFAAHAGGVDFNFRISLLYFSWPRFYNQVQSWTVPVVAALPLLFARYPLAKILCVIVLGLHWYVILMTGARGSFLALSAAMLFAVIFLPSVRGLLLKWQLAGAALGVLLYAGVLFSFQAPADAPDQADAPQQAEPSQGFYGNEDEDTSGFMAQSVGRPLLDPMGRTGMWRQTLRDARAHPLLGIGPMNYVCTSPAYIGHPHNFPLQLAAEWGVPVALAVSLLFAALVVQGTAGLRRRDLEDVYESALGGLLLTGVVAAALHACVSGVMVMPASQVAGLVVTGTLIGTIASRQAPARMALPGRYLRIAAMAITAGLLALGANELQTMHERSAQLRPGEDMRPRIWQDAKVCRLYTGQNAVTN